jgi:hypothetical protein
MTAATVALAALLLADPATVATGPSGAAAVERFLGVARAKDGSVAYVETHVVHLENGRVRSAETRYERPDGTLIARLVSEYPAGSFAPDYEFEDLRTGAREALRRAGDGLELRDGERARRVRIPEEGPIVAGQGLDRFARSNLDALARGEELRVTLALPGRLDAFGFRLRGERLASGLVRVRFEPTSFVLRVLAPSIEAEYEPASGRLLRYSGVSNVAAEDGSSQRVEIAYSYPEPSSS